MKLWIVDDLQIVVDSKQLALKEYEYPSQPDLELELY